MRISRLLGATAIASVLAMPAMAQTVLFQGTNVNNFDVNVGAVTVLQQLNQAGDFDYTSMPLNIDTLTFAIPYETSLGRNNVSEVVQIATGELNVVAPGAIDGDFIIVQGAGNYALPDATNSPVFGNTVVSIVNANGVWTENPLLSASVVAGSQIGQINVNTISTAVGASDDFSQVWQQAGTDGTFLGLQPPAAGIPAGPVLSVDNMMIAMTDYGTADVRGTLPDEDIADAFVAGGQQAAVVNLNGINFAIEQGALLNLVSPDEDSLGVKQELTANNSIAVRNVAAAVALYNTNSTIDPSVSDIRQTAVANVNSISLSTQPIVTGTGEDAVTTYGSADVNLEGLQSGIPAGDAATYVRLGNVAAGVAGEPAIGAFAINDTDFWTANPAAGVAAIDNVQQIAALQLNTISNPLDAGDEDGEGVVNLALSGAGVINLSDPALDPRSSFQQTFDGSTLQIVPVELGGTNTVNLMVASTMSGSATIGNEGQQAFIVNINSVDVGGELSGGLVQDAVNVGANESGEFSNVALAVVQGGAGAAKIDGLTQVMQQSYNTVGAGTLADLALVQNASAVNLSNNNVATATSLGGLGSLNNVIQVSSLDINSISAGTLNTGVGSITQNSNAVNLASVNTLQTTGLTTSIAGAIQQSTVSLNAIGVK